MIKLGLFFIFLTVLLMQTVLAYTMLKGTLFDITLLERMQTVAYKYLLV